MATLAISGGPKVVTIAPNDRWKLIRQPEIDLVVEMMQRDEISTFGEGVMKEAEEKFGRMVGRKFCLSQCNGTSTLMSAYFALGIGAGDEVIVPCYTWHAQVSPILHTHGVPVFCEIDPKTLTMDPEDMERRITSRTKAISVVHLWGNIANMDAIMSIARKHHLPVIEDCSHAHGGEYGGKKVGSIGDIGCFSFQGTKAIVGGEAGFIVTDNVDYYERILILGHYGRLEKDLITEKYRFLLPMGIGFKFRAHPLAMGIAKVQMDRLEEINRRREAIFRQLDEGLSWIPCIQVLSINSKAKRGGFYGYRMIYRSEKLDGIPRSLFLKALQAEGVPASECRYFVFHTHPLYNGYNFLGPDCPYGPPGPSQRQKYERGSMPVSEKVFDNLIALPVYTDPPEGLLEQIVQAFDKVVKNKKELASLHP
jgi:perosamine synthetase